MMSILIDEAQDYKEEWIRILMTCFAHKETEIVAFADEKQNIYSRMLDGNKMPKNPIQVGAWNKRLNVNYRLGKKISLLSDAYARHFYGDKYEVDYPNSVNESTNLALFGECVIEYLTAYHIKDKYYSIASFIYLKMRELSVNSNDVCVLGFNVETIRLIDQAFRRISKEKTKTMFESQEEFEIIRVQSMDDKGNVNEELLKTKSEKLRGNRKYHFWLNDGTVKFSTIHSFKGLEIPFAFVIVENNAEEASADELLYVGITRAKINLSIINLDNKEYDSFFKTSEFVDFKGELPEVDPSVRSSVCSKEQIISIDDAYKKYLALDDIRNGYGR